MDRPNNPPTQQQVTGAAQPSPLRRGASKLPAWMRNRQTATYLPLGYSLWFGTMVLILFAVLAFMNSYPIAGAALILLAIGCAILARRVLRMVREGK